MADAAHQSTAAGFRDVDGAADPDALIAHLDRASANRTAQERKQRMFRMLRLQPGDAVLDAGCGVGTDLLELARIVGPTGRAVGVDLSTTLLAEARRRAEVAGVRAELVQRDLSSLDFPDGTFHGCHSERVLLHVDDPAAVVKELARVLRASGRLVIFDVDFGTWALDLPDRDVQRRVETWRSDLGHRNGWIGRQLPRLFAEAGLTDIEIEPYGQATFGVTNPRLDNYKDQVGEARAAGAISGDEAAAYLAAIEEADAVGRLMVATMPFTVAGRKP